MTRTDLIVIIETGQFAQDSDDIIKYVDPSFTIIMFFTAGVFMSMVIYVVLKVMFVIYDGRRGEDLHHEIFCLLRCEIRGGRVWGMRMAVVTAKVYHADLTLLSSRSRHPS